MVAAVEQGCGRCDAEGVGRRGCVEAGAASRHRVHGACGGGHAGVVQEREFVVVLVRGDRGRDDQRRDDGGVRAAGGADADASGRQAGR
ncbi:hypothetical protein DP115_33640 [Brasilonema octagenarum UFV-OR1]|uniref:Uncharacterized protein n=1 Tax=Brasilonema octagenarum UFV-OR1 TaxID=417115 RepID=A0ABX1MHW9_9CYAN|nr:hypothetical protein [Brasilonema octagenarum UFV-OR1]